MRPGPRIPYCGLKGSIWEPSSPRNARGLTLPFVEEVSISRMSLGSLSQKLCFHSVENTLTVPYTWCSDCNDKLFFRYLKTCNHNICFNIIQGVGKNLPSLIVNRKQIDLQNFKFLTYYKTQKASVDIFLSFIVVTLKISSRIAWLRPSKLLGYCFNSLGTSSNLKNKHHMA